MSEIGKGCLYYALAVLVTIVIVIIVGFVVLLILAARDGADF